MKIDGKVTITIEMGNDAMQTERDLAKALIELARRIKKDGLDRVTKVIDDNGNIVGEIS